VICAQCDIVILPRICTIWECRNLCIRRGKPPKREKSGFRRFLCTSRWWAESLQGRPRHAIEFVFKSPIWGRLQNELSLVGLVILIGQRWVFCVVQTKFSYGLERVFWDGSFSGPYKTLPQIHHDRFKAVPTRAAAHFMSWQHHQLASCNLVCLTCSQVFLNKLLYPMMLRTIMAIRHSNASPTPGIYISALRVESLTPVNSFNLMLIPMPRPSPIARELGFQLLGD
jgi:hypothetical protein